MRIRWDPVLQRFPALTGKLIVKTYRGLQVVQAWPRPRGRPKSQPVREQVAWFKRAVQYVKHADPRQQTLAIEAAKGTGLYPRDILLKAMSEGLVDIALPDGRLLTYHRPRLDDVVFQGVILEENTVTAIPAGTVTKISWPLPIIDTFTFWNVATPTRVTIPEGIDVIELTAGWGHELDGPTAKYAAGFFKNGIRVDWLGFNAAGWPGFAVVKGPLLVAEGDYFEFFAWSDAAKSTKGDSRTFLTLKVLRTT